MYKIYKHAIPTEVLMVLDGGEVQLPTTDYIGNCYYTVEDREQPIEEITLVNKYFNLKEAIIECALLNAR